MKQIIFAALSAIALIGNTAQVAAAEGDIDRELLLFTAEVDNYINLAEQLKSEPKNSEEVFNQMKDSSSRIAATYFEKMLQKQGGEAQLNAYLQQTVKQNKELKSELVVLGNAFVDKATEIISQSKGVHKDYRFAGLAGGAVVGVVLAGASLALQVKGGLGSGAMAVSGGVLIACPIIGYMIGKSNSVDLPSDPSIQSAKDFYARYPKGEDFIKDLDRSTQDLRLLNTL